MSHKMFVCKKERVCVVNARIVFLTVSHCHCQAGLLGWKCVGTIFQYKNHTKDSHLNYKGLRVTVNFSVQDTDVVLFFFTIIFT
jgi:hypothetical protein